jgi:hypothetical protein
VTDQAVIDYLDDNYGLPVKWRKIKFWDSSLLTKRARRDRRLYFILKTKTFALS